MRSAAPVCPLHTLPNSAYTLVVVTDSHLPWPLQTCFASPSADSRESVAQVILAAAENPGAGDGRVWDIMNGDDEPKEAVAKAIKEGVNSWHD